jgi:hypothetical protein
MTPATYRIGRVIAAPATALCTALLLAALASPLAAQQLPQQPNAIRQRLAQAGQSEPAPAKPVSSNQAAAPAKPGAASAKPVASGKPATAAASAKTAAASAKPVAGAARRDPFDPLIDKEKAGSAIPANLPPGKAGLMVATLNIDGIVRGPNGMIAVVSNPQMRVYFLRQGDQLYDGQVGTITMEAVSFHQMGKDPFGAVIEQDLTRRLYPSPGEQP